MSQSERANVDRFRTHGREYVLRRASIEDVDAICRLNEDVLGESFPPEWFEWKYVENPYTDEIDVFVAETGGDVVGSCGFWSIPIHTGTRTTRVVQPGDAAVHEDHRRRGVYSRILKRSLELFAASGIEFTIDFPNERTQGAFEKLGWRLVEKRPTYYRIQRPLSQLGIHSAGRGRQLLHRASGNVTRRALDLWSHTGPTVPDEVSVERHEVVPAETLATIYRRAIPDAFHAPRTETFVRWRFSNPRWDYTGYVARRRGEPVAGVVVGTNSFGEVETARIADVVPLAPEPDREHAMAAVVGTALRGLESYDVVVAPGDVIPKPVRRKYGFLGDRAFPLSMTTTPTIHGTFRLGEGSDEEWYVDGKRLDDARNWRVTFAEYDTG